MNDRDTAGRRDAELGELLERSVGVPGAGAELRERLERSLTDVDRETVGIRHDAGARTAWLRRPTVLVAAGFAALIALVLLLDFSGLPGVRQTVPPSATAATRLVAAIDAGLTRVKTLQGVFVFNEPVDSYSGSVHSVAFASSSNGNQAFDARYLPDYGELQKGWLQTKQSAAPPSVKRHGMMQYAAKIRQRVAVNGRTGFMQSKTWSVDPVTRRLVSVRYRYYRGLVVTGGRVLIAPHDVQQIWLLSSQLRSALAEQQPSVTLSDASFRGRPMYRAVVDGRNGKPAYVALVDKEYGITLRVTSVPGSRSSDELGLTPFHIRDLRINEPIDPSRFVMKPDYRHAPDGFSKRRPTDTPSKYGIDLGERAFPVSALPQHTSSWTLLPTWIPKGYSLQMAVSWPDYSWMWLTYRQGLSDITVGTAGKNATGPRTQKTGASTGFVFRVEPGVTWPGIGSGVQVMPAGAMEGWPAGHGDLSYPGRTSVSTATFAVSGNVPSADLQRMAESMRQVKAGPYLPSASYTWQPWAALAAVAAAVVGMFLFVRARRRRAADLGAPLPMLKSIRLPLTGLVLVAAGASQSWHRLYGSGNDFSILGWRDPLAVATVAAALLAIVAAMWILAAPRRTPVGPRFLSTAFGSLALAGTLVSVVYLPIKARFVTDLLGTDLTWSGISSLGTYLQGVACPAPGPGLYLAVIGACLIVVGGLRLKPRRDLP